MNPSTLIGELFVNYPQVIHSVNTDVGPLKAENGEENLSAGVELALILLNATGEFSDLVINGSPLFHEFADLLIGVHYGCVVPVSEKLTDFGK